MAEKLDLVWKIILPFDYFSICKLASYKDGKQEDTLEQKVLCLDDPSLLYRLYDFEQVV